MVRLVILVIGSYLFSGSAWAQACTDIGKIDFRNSIIPTSSHDENELQTLFNEASDLGSPFDMRDGKAFPDSPDQNSPEWEAELLVDRLINPDSSTWIRILVVENSHLKGPGSWRFVLGVSCRDGHVIPVFRFSAEGVTLRHLDTRAILLYQAIWTHDDSHASPSLHREVRYEWNKEQHRFIRASASTPSAGAVFQPDEK
jgi:hypothetical protein